MKGKKTATIHMPVSEEHGMPIFSDYLEEVARLYEREKSLKNIAYYYIVDKGLIDDFNEFLSRSEDIA